MVGDVIRSFKLNFVKCSLEACERRNVKGMYRKAGEGYIQQFTSVSSPL